MYKAGAKSGGPILVETVVQGFQADLEEVGRFLLVPVTMLEGGENQPLLDLRDGRAHAGHQARGRQLLVHLEGQRVDAHVSFREDEGATNDVLELAHISRP